MTKTKDRYQTSYGTSLKDVKGLNNRLLLLLSGGIRKVDKDGKEIPLGRNFKRGIIDPIVGTARGALRIAKPLLKSAYEELYVNPALERDKEYQSKKKKYEDKTIDVRESELAGREVTITEGKGLKIERGKTKLQKETDIILDQNKGNTKKDPNAKEPPVINEANLTKKKKEELAIKKKNNPFADVGYE
jgi:hypothetical protein